jgi:dTDP-L-rhamnose 4-epimerase
MTHHFILNACSSAEIIYLIEESNLGCQKTVAEVFGSDLAPKIPNEYRFGDTRHIFSDIGKLKALGWVPKRTILDSIKEYKQYLEQQTDINDILDYSEKYMKNLGVVRRANR